MRWPVRVLLFWAIPALGTVACGATPPAAAGGTQFVAYEGDFAGFHNWPSAPAAPSPALPALDAGNGVDSGSADGGVVHVLPLTEYWNHPPPSRSTTFPIGTIIVKETDQADPTARQVFAMVKRGADFNPAGAVNWEWFDLTNVADGTVKINWRGYGPVSGSADIYGGDPHICNDCHEIAVSNDYVWSAALQLSNF